MNSNLPAIEEKENRGANGKAMQALSSRQQQFVLALLQQGVSKTAARKAAAETGFAPEYGYQLLRNDLILTAIREEATKRVAGAALVGVTVMLDIAQNPDHKDQFQAAKQLMALNGFTAEQRIVVEHIDRDAKDKIQEIRLLADKLGLDPRQLIAQAGVVVDAEFEEVTPARVDDSDW